MLSKLAISKHRCPNRLENQLTALMKGRINMPFQKEVFAANLRSRRAAFHISQEELADKSGVSKSVITHYENARFVPSASNLFKLCESLGCDPNYLCGWTEDQR